MRKINKLIIHHTASGRDITTLDMINAWHKARWADFQSTLGFWVGYHYVIGKDWIKQTRSNQEDGAHTYGFNHDSIGICLTGNFENEQPNNYQLEELRKLLVGLMAEYGLKEKDIYLHKELTATACPGRNLPHSLITLLLHPKETVAPNVALYEVEKQKMTAFIKDIEAVINKYK